MPEFEAALWRKIRQQSGFNTQSDWTDADIIRLSSLLEANSGVLVDRSRLKTLILRSEQVNWEENQDLLPAIARLSGYESWEALQAELNAEKSPASNGEPENQALNEAILTSRNPQSWIFGLLMLLIMVLAFFYWKHNPKKGSGRITSVQSSAPARVR